MSPEEITKESDSPASLAGGLAEVEDILADVEIASPVIAKPDETAQIVAEPKKMRSKLNLKILIIPLVVIIVAGLIYGGYLLVKSLPQRLMKEKAIETPPVTEQQPAAPPVQIMPVADADGDGLTDTEELSLGTNLNQPDTDGDSLFDKEEVKIYNTDPLKADTDGDGIADGVEVGRGEDPVNPTAGAKLLDLQKEIDNLK